MQSKNYKISRLLEAHLIIRRASLAVSLVESRGKIHQIEEVIRKAEIRIVISNIRCRQLLKLELKRRIEAL